VSEQSGTGDVWRVQGSPTDSELAAVVAAVTAATSAAAASAGPGSSHVGATDVTSGWAAYWRNLRQPLPAGPGAWWASSQPGG
jgi:hypothetical protein